MEQREDASWPWSAEEEEGYVEQALLLAQRAVEAGNHPFGALLVAWEPFGEHKRGDVVLQAENAVHTERDLTRHAELVLVSEACKRLSEEERRKCTLFTSTEPCCMCAGAIFWAHIRQVGFGCSGLLLDEIAGPIFEIPCKEIFARSIPGERVLSRGPILEAKCRAIHDQYW